MRSLAINTCSQSVIYCRWYIMYILRRLRFLRETLKARLTKMLRQHRYLSAPQAELPIQGIAYWLAVWRQLNDRVWVGESTHHMGKVWPLLLPYTGGYTIIVHVLARKKLVSKHLWNLAGGYMSAFSLYVGHSNTVELQWHLIARTITNLLISLTHL